MRRLESRLWLLLWSALLLVPAGAAGSNQRAEGATTLSAGDTSALAARPALGWRASQTQQYQGGGGHAALSGPGATAPVAPPVVVDGVTLPPTHPRLPPASAGHYPTGPPLDS